jgi:hypothetical protein
VARVGGQAREKAEAVAARAEAAREKAEAAAAEVDARREAAEAEAAKRQAAKEMAEAQRARETATREKMAAEKARCALRCRCWRWCRGGVLAFGGTRSAHLGDGDRYCVGRSVTWLLLATATAALACWLNLSVRQG